MAVAAAGETRAGITMGTTEATETIGAAMTGAEVADLAAVAEATTPEVAIRRVATAAVRATREAVATRTETAAEVPVDQYYFLKNVRHFGNDGESANRSPESSWILRLVAQIPVYKTAADKMWLYAIEANLRTFTWCGRHSFHAYMKRKVKLMGKRDTDGGSRGEKGRGATRAG